MIAAIIGVLLGLAIAVFARMTAMDRERSFYTTVAIVVASYYPLFAVLGESSQALTIEVATSLAFSVVATLGFQRNMWLVAAAIAGHGVFDLTLHPFVDNPGMPVWWPIFCAAIDLFLGAWLAVTLCARSSKSCPRHLDRCHPSPAR